MMSKFILFHGYFFLICIKISTNCFNIYGMMVINKVIAFMLKTSPMLWALADVDQK